MHAELARLARRLLEGQAVVGGVLSGTSADGIDVALARLDGAGSPELLAFATEPFPGDLGPRLREVLDGAPTGLREAALLHRDLGRAFGEAARRVAGRSGLVLELLGSHGQTVWHHDDVEPSGPASLQLGDGDHVARAAGCPVVSDFRQADLAAGGGGAPLVPVLDLVLLADRPRPWATLNLGGMANLTLVGDSPVAFDVGPACSLLDGLARRLLGRARDEDGAVAASGRPLPELVQRVLAHPFYLALPPRSTGRDTFGAPWVDALVQAGDGAAPRDLLASASEAIARSVAQALERFGPGGCRELIVAGGGIHHLDLMERLERALPCPLVPSHRRGIDPDAREGLLFALLAARWVLGRPSSLPWATGAHEGVVLGRLSPGPRGAEGA